MATITSNIKTRGGSGSIEISHDGTELPDGESFEVSDVSELSIDFDLEDDSDDASNIYFSPSEFEFSCFDELSNGDSLFLALDSIVSTDELTVNLDFTTDGGNQSVNEFTFNTSDVGYSREDRMVTIKCSTDLKNQILVQDVFANHSDDVANRENSHFGANIMTAYDFVKNYFAEHKPDDTFIEDSHMLLQNQAFNDGQESWVIVNAGGVQGSELEYNASTRVYELGAIEGAFVGSVFGYSFFINRLNTNESVSLSEDDATSLDIKIGLNSYYEISMSCIEDPSPSFLDTAPPSDGILNTLGDYIDFTNSDLNPDGFKRLSVYFELDTTFRAFYNASACQFEKEDKSDATSLIREDVAEGSRTIPVDSVGFFSVGDLVHFADSLNGRRSDQIYEVVDVIPTYDEVVIDRPVERDYTQKDVYSNGGSTITVFPYLCKFSKPMFSPPALRKGINSYKKAYGADGANMVELEILDLDRIKPSDAILLDSSFTEAVRNKYYRPSKITYDLLSDKIIIEAYYIADV